MYFPKGSWPHQVVAALVLASFLSFPLGCRAAAAPTGIGPFAPTADPNARYAQTLMTQTVKITTKILAETTLQDDSGKSRKVQRTAEWMGSGTVVMVDPTQDNGQSLILTAKHVAHVDDTIDMEMGWFVVTWKIVAAEQTINTLDGRVCLAESFLESRDDDLAIMRADCIAGSVAELATELPPVGAIVQDVGAPLGWHPKMAFSVTDGRYTGLQDGLAPLLSVSLPAAPGCSGSGLYHNGKVFGVLVQGSREYHHLILGVQLKHVQGIVMAAKMLWEQPDSAL